MENVAQGQQIGSLHGVWEDLEGSIQYTSLCPEEGRGRTGLGWTFWLLQSWACYLCRLKTFLEALKLFLSQQPN